MVAEPHAFNSYLRTDSDIARQVRAHLAAAGVANWMDEFNIWAIDGIWAASSSPVR